jgi:hypothetical protein
MLTAALVETGAMISRVIHFVSIACCALVVVSFALFARDQMAGASAHQQTALVAGASSAPASSSAAKHHAQPRRFIDDAAKVLTTPFDAVVRSSNEWVKQGLPAVFALIVYGVGLGYLARFASVRS